MNNEENKNNNEDITRPFSVLVGMLLGITLSMMAVDKNSSQQEVEEAAKQYLESLESNHDLNKKLDTLIEEFSPRSGNVRLGDKFEEYLGITLDPTKKERLDGIAEELDDMKAVAEDRMTISHFKKVQGENALKAVNEVISENIMEDNELDSNISFQFGKNYGWVVADEYYQIYDEILNEYASSYEILNSYTPNNNREEYQNIVSGVLKSCLCDIVLDENSANAKVVIPNEVKGLVNKK